MFEEEEEELGPQGSFISYLAEGDKLFLACNFKKALKFYSTALEVESSNILGLVARSKCYLQLGDAQAALRDAEASLEDNSDYHRGLYHKAEALYQMGDFEFALVFYHRGHKLRPELQEFRLGIQKCQEAIDNCVGSPSSVKLETRGDLSFFDKMDEGKGKSVARSQYKCPRRPTVGKSNRQQSKTHRSTSGRTAKAMLGELYADKEYLEKLLKDEDLVKGSQGGMNIYDLVLSGIQYLDTRTEFWRQQKPMYARKRDRLLLQRKWSSNPEKDVEPTAFILKNLEKIDYLLAESRGTESLEMANATLSAVERMPLDVLPNREDVIANLHSCIGNAYLEMGKTEEALQHHQIDFDISKNHQFLDAKSRALDNLGRVYARIGKFQSAIDCWEEKLPLSRSPLESTWLYHEIGRCHLELNVNDKAKEFGQSSLQEARKAGDAVWQLNASVLIAQAQVKLEDYAEAIESFRRGLEMAKQQRDETAQIAITKALEDVTIKRSKQFRQADVEANVTDPISDQEHDSDDDN